MRVLITGGTGLLGNNVLRAFLADNHEVVSTVRPSSDRRPLAGLGVELANIDLDDPSDVRMTVADVDLVVHAAALAHIGWSKLEASRKTNVQATRHLAEAARRKGKRMIHVSSVDALAAMVGDAVGSETDLEPPCPPCSYVVSKREAEQAVLDEVARGLDAVIVNPGFMMGPWDWKPSSGKMMLALHKVPLLLYVPAGGCSVVDVRDVAAGIVAAAEFGKTGERYILGGTNMSYLELWTLMAKAMKKWPPRIKMSNFLASGTGKVGDLISWIVRKEIDVNSAMMAMGQINHWYSSEKANRELGYRYGSAEDAVFDAWDWFKKFGYV
jgi:dihydroflavonol-4-reductase